MATNRRLMRERRNAKKAKAARREREAAFIGGDYRQARARAVIHANPRLRGLLSTGYDDPGPSRVTYGLSSEPARVQQMLGRMVRHPTGLGKAAIAAAILDLANAKGKEVVLIDLGAPSEDEIEAKARELGLADRVHLPLDLTKLPVDQIW